MEKETEQELIKKMIGFQKEEITSSIFVPETRKQVKYGLLQQSSVK